MMEAAIATHQRRAGTSGYAGQLYEIKMAMLTLLNAKLAKRRGDIKFWLGTNVDKLGAADDVVVKCMMHGREKVSFLQCKHRENPKCKVTLHDVLKEDGEFSLVNLLDSYFSILDKCDTEDDVVLKDVHENIEIVMYTPAETNFGNAAVELDMDQDDFIISNKEGKVFRFKNSGEHIDVLLQSMSQRRAKSLAKLLAGLLLSDNEDNLMVNYLVQIYHVYLREHVLLVSDSVEQNTRKVHFRSNFFKSKDPFVSQLHKLLRNEILMCKKRSNITNVNSEELQIILNAIPEILSRGDIEILTNKSKKKELFINELREKLKEQQVTSPAVDNCLTELINKKIFEIQAIQVPNTFGNIDLKIRKDRRLDHLSKQIVKILQNCDIMNNSVKIERRHVGRDKWLKKKDVQINGGIGGLVGNLFILDEKTKMLKINTDENSLPMNAKKLLIKLKDTISKEDLKIDLSRYRFQFNIRGFPRVLWDDEEADRNVLMDFLSKYKFYSGQAKEDNMEDIIKEKMITYYNTDFNVDRTFIHVKHKIETWWRKKNKAAYLTESCDYFDKMDKPDLLHTIKFIHTNEVSNRDIVFSATSLQSLGIENFMTQSEHRMLNIITNNLTLSTIKLLQYFQNDSKLRYNFSIIDMKYVQQNNLYDDVLKEIRNTQIKNIIIKSAEFDDKVCSLCKEVQEGKKKFFILTRNRLSEIPKYIQDEKNEFLDLSQESQTELLENTRILFQEQEINLKELLINEQCKSLINIKILDEIISKGRIVVGKPLADEKYNTLKGFYINRKLHRCVNLKKEFSVGNSQLNDEKMKTFIITYNKYINKPTINQGQDIFLISDNIKDFEELCTMYKNCIHWFHEKNNRYIWNQSRGRLNNIREYVDIDETTEDNCLLNTMVDIDDKTVIIAAGPGMGKTSLLTHLSIATKRMYPSMWIVRINLLDLSDYFSNWKKNNVNVDKEEAFSFLTEMIASTNSETPLSVFEKRLFDQYYRSGKVALIFDGYDEISPDYKDQVIELLVNLNTNMLKKMWVATRPYDIQHELENRLGAFSYKLVPLSKDDQKLSLMRYCSGQTTLADVVLRCMEAEMQTILATPLHLYMIVKVIQNQSKGIINKINDLHNLYKRFIDIKVKEIYFPEKLQLSKESNPNQQCLIDKEYRDICSNHTILAVAVMFSKDELSCILNKQEREKLKELIEKINKGEEKTGIIDRVVDGMPAFVHWTFAEYFLVEYFCDKLKLGIVSDIISKLLLNNLNVVKFFDGKIANDRSLLELDSNSAFCENILVYSCNKHTSLLCISMMENLKYVVMFYWKVINNYLRKSNFYIINNFAHNCRLFEIAFIYDQVSFVSDMLDTPAFENPQLQITGRLELLAHILWCAIDNLKHYQLIASFTSIIDKIIRKGEQLEELLVFISSHDIYYCGELRRALLGYHFHILLSYLDKLTSEQIMRVTTVSDRNGWTLAYEAARVQNIEFFYYLTKRLIKTKFRTLCLTAADHRETLILMLFNKLKNNEKLVNDYSELSEYICPSDDEDETESEFDEELLRKLYMIAATCKFNENGGWFIRRMSKEVQHYFSSNKEDVNFGIELLCYAVASDNENIITKLFLNVKEADRTMDILMTKCENKLTTLEKLAKFAPMAKCFNFLVKYLNRLSPNQLVEVVTVADSKGRTIMHHAAKTQDFSEIDSITCHLKRLNIKQLIRITTVTDKYGRMPAHEAVDAQNFTYFDYLKKRLNNKKYFRRICFAKRKYESVPAFGFILDEKAERHSSLCEYICPSNDEDETEFDKVSLRSMYLVAASCKSLFNLNTRWFTSKMLKEIKQYLNSDDDRYFGRKLLDVATLNNNKAVIKSLLEDVTDEYFKEMLSVFFYKSVTTQVVVLLNLLSERLNRNDFRVYCFEKDRMYLLISNVVMNKCDLHVTDYLQLCEYICPSSDENETEFDEVNLRSMYLVATSCKYLFTLNTGWFISKMLQEVTHYCNSNNENEFDYSIYIISLSILCKNEDFLCDLFQNIVDINRIRDIMIILFNSQSMPDRETILCHAMRHNISSEVLRLDQLNPEQLLSVAQTVHYKPDMALNVATRKTHLDFVYLLKNNLNRVNFGRLCVQINGLKRTVLQVLCDNMCLEADDGCVNTCVSLCEYIFPTDEEDAEGMDEEYLHSMCMFITQYEQLCNELRDSWLVKHVVDKISKHWDSDGIDFYTSNMYTHTARRCGNTALLRKMSAPSTRYVLQALRA